MKKGENDVVNAETKIFIYMSSGEQQKFSLGFSVKSALRCYFWDYGDYDLKITFFILLEVLFNEV